MESIHAGDLVKVAVGSAQRDGIVADPLSGSKVVVAIVDRARGPVLRTVPASALSERTEPGDDDRALQLLLRRTHPAARGAGRAGTGGGSGRAGHARPAMHRTTGK